MLKRYGDEADIESAYGRKSLLKRATGLERRCGAELLMLSGSS